MKYKVFTVLFCLGFPSLEANPEQCKHTLLNLLKSYGMTVNDLKSPQKVNEFKRRAQREGKWAQFGKVCNNPNYKNCKTCTCNLDLSLNSCMLNCGCCWGNTSCSSS